MLTGSIKKEIKTRRKQVIVKIKIPNRTKNWVDMIPLGQFLMLLCENHSPLKIENLPVVSSKIVGLYRENDIIEKQHNSTDGMLCTLVRDMLNSLY